MLHNGLFGAILIYENVMCEYQIEKIASLDESE